MPAPFTWTGKPYAPWLGKLPGVRRPAIASLFPTVKGPALVLDVGASLVSRPADLLDFAVMGDTFARHVLGRERPRIGLMNIGEESTKGGEVVIEADRERMCHGHYLR